MTEHQKQQRGKLAEQLFSAKSAYRTLSQNADQSDRDISDKALLLSDIQHWLSGNSGFDNQTIIAKINHSLPLRTLYQQLLKQHQFAYSGMQAAASSEVELPERTAQQFKLKFKRDKFNPEQVFVILFIEHAKPEHSQNEIQVHIEQNDQLTVLFFPPLEDGKSQLLMEESSEDFALLASSDSQITLV